MAQIKLFAKSSGVTKPPSERNPTKNPESSSFKAVESPKLGAKQGSPTLDPETKLKNGSSKNPFQIASVNTSNTSKPLPKITKPNIPPKPKLVLDYYPFEVKKAVVKAFNDGNTTTAVYRPGRANSGKKSAKKDDPLNALSSLPSLGTSSTTSASKSAPGFGKLARHL